ncbi:hypothetical protein [Marmoricola endophyticus]|uniref:hypothetical protein n=1 Tax=Marmoricola endophyticus TaxID=2040280 RepID=UPI00166D8A6F|nr:hypothetical protein [Marmoricola endophyticus]
MFSGRSGVAAVIADRVGSRLVDGVVRRVVVGRGDVRVDIVVRFGAHVDEVARLARVLAVHALEDLDGSHAPLVDVRVVDVDQQGGSRVALDRPPTS